MSACLPVWYKMKAAAELTFGSVKRSDERTLCDDEVESVWCAQQNDVMVAFSDVFSSCENRFAGNSRASK